MKKDNFYEITVSVPKDSTQEDARLFLINEIYKVSCLFYETIGEHGELLRGNGHHMAQELASKAEEIWNRHSPRQQKPIHQQIIDTVGEEEAFCELAGIKQTKK